MYDYIKGNLAELTPTEITVECYGIGYKILISLGTYSKLQKSGNNLVTVYLYHHIREDDELFYGFYDKEEREIFIQLISVSGIGPNSARMMLSSLNSDEIRNAIISQDVNKIKSVKGIGLKTAQRVILELKDKIIKGSSKDFIFDTGESSSTRDEAMSALVLLGFTKQNVEKVLNTLFKENSGYSLEELIKKALKLL
ncbi:MAG: Holliday junction branch migration protein RuvA [Bacteroidales bacterium]|nr:Holliday junction branch migration protein RuvA [Bacteroidales bacterium]MDD4670730.1 Holliday junction branch migration protein RuvA [Bacteroidales bacterium]